LVPALTSWRDGERERQRRDQWRYRVAWEPVEIDATESLSGTWLVITGSHQTVDESLVRWTSGLEAALTTAGATVRHETFDGGAPDAFGPLEGVDGVVSLLSVAGDVSPPARGDVSTGLLATLRLIQVLARAGFAGRMWAMTSDAVSVGPADGAPAPEQAQVWGLGRVAGLEHPGLWGGLIDLPSGQHLTETIGRQLVGVLTAGTEDQVALRQDVVLGRRLVHAPIAPVTPTDRSWQPRGTVLITGGTGGLGAHVARWVAQRGAEHVVLVSRRGTDAPGAQELVDDLAAEGCRATIAACDVSDHEAVAELLAGIPEEHPLDVVVHTAGVVDDSVLTAMTEEQLAATARSKVLGALVLHELTTELPLSAFVLFSSAAAVVGSPGQGNYAAGNAFLDALAQLRRSLQLPATSVAWGPWAGAGMATVGDVEEQLRRQGMVPMPATPALAALETALTRDDATVVIGDFQWDRFVSTHAAQRPMPLLAGLPEVAASVAKTARAAAGSEAAADAGAPSLRDRLTACAPSERFRTVLEVVRGESAAVLGHRTSTAVDPHQEYRQAGFDSLAALNLRNRLGAATDLPIPTSLVYDHPTPDAVARYLLDAFDLAEPEAADELLDGFDRLERQLVRTESDGELRTVITKRLENLLWRWRDAGAPDADGPTPEDDLESASADEMFALIDRGLDN
ncbi:beta-ketoacyl reductase, partial [Streptomyces sp. NPDC047315]|uniref:beta-ketoacyl reductase n=1 Tax=Streptomyces sp. NPDC047315 TaxID=3155142 RepID=UPI0033C2ADCA